MDRIRLGTRANVLYSHRFFEDGTVAGSERIERISRTQTQTDSAVAMNRAGQFVTAWTSAGQDGSGAGVYAFRNISGPFLFDAFEPDEEARFFFDYGRVGSRVATDAEGNFVVVWNETNNSDEAATIYAQRFDSEGRALDDGFQVSETRNGNSAPDVAMTNDGRFVVVWERDFSGFSNQLYARMYSANGTPLNEEFGIDVPGDDSEEQRYAPSIVITDNGGFAVAWQHLRRDGGFLRQTADFARYDSSGNLIGAPTRVDIEREVRSIELVRQPNGFLVTWSDQDSVSTYRDLARRYNSSGQALTGPFVLATHDHSRSNTAVAVSPSGDFLLTWLETTFGADDDKVWARAFTAAGTPKGDAILLFSDAYQQNEDYTAPTVTAHADGRFTILTGREDFFTGADAGGQDGPPPPESICS